MRFIKMTGGLGNQMFIYALYIAMHRKWADARIDLSDMAHYHAHNGYELHRVFRLPENEFRIAQPLKKVMEFLFFKTILERKQGGRLEPYFGSHRWPLVYYKGFYQNERYFSECRDEVRRAFTFQPELASERTRRCMAEIDACPCAVSFHVRRGDYLLPKFQNLGGVCGPTYYRNALEHISRHLPQATIYLFSDDTEWARQNLPLPPQTVVVDWNTGADSWQDMMLMSHCRHNAICNSTFSWWGAWLNRHADKTVIAPDTWFGSTPSTEFVPAEWIRLAVR